MELHANAALSLTKRRRLCERIVEGRTVTEAPAAPEVSVRCARECVGRYLTDRELGLRDRSSAPMRVANRTDERRVEAIAALRRLRFTGPEIAGTLGMPLATGILTRIGMGRLGLEPAPRYEHERPGELIHVDVKKLGRIERGAGHRVTGIKHYNPRRDRAAPSGAPSVGNTCTSRSTTAPGSPTPRCSPTRKPPPRSAASGAPSPSTPGTASRSSGC
jgi:hypothetical protein